MLIRAGYDLVCNFPQSTPAIFMLYVHPSREHLLKNEDRMLTEPALSLNNYLDYFGNRCARIRVPAGRLRLRNEIIISDSGRANVINNEAKPLPVDELPSEVLPFLLASRYCEVDLMGDIAWDLFGKMPNNLEKVHAIADWVHHNIRFDYQLARRTRTALETYHERVGVCRDYTHLAITLYRALHIPTRYATGYLGDIGIEPLPFPMDFSSWAEVFLSGTWYIVDPRHNIPRIGHIPIAYGRDAADVAIMTSFGQNYLEKFEIWTDELAE